MPPRLMGRAPPSNNHQSASEEARRNQLVNRRGGPPTQELDIFADPPDATKSRDRKPRRNSESSVRDKGNGFLDPDSERRRQERRLREAKKSDKGKPKPAVKKLDIIDKLDVTSIYGTGCKFFQPRQRARVLICLSVFHHDGPFDACNPARNRKNVKNAPMQAFPKDSKNMQMGGSGPLNSRLNLDQFNGVGQEAHIDYNEAAIVDEDAAYSRRPQPDRGLSFHPTTKVEPLHGEETAGLGTSTFLDGAPASRNAIQRRESENEAAVQERVTNAGGLGRKKSLAQRIRAVRPNLRDGGRMNSPEPMMTPSSPLGTGKSDTAANPFFKEYSTEYERKGAQISFAEEQGRTGRARAPSSPKRSYALERKTTNDSTGAGDAEPKTLGGFLNRVKSMKTKTRPRGDRRETNG